MRSSTAVLIKNFTITPLTQDVEAGIYVWYDSNNCTITGNRIANFSEAISYSRNWYGIRLDGRNCNIAGNTFQNDGLIVPSSTTTGNIIENNTVNGKPLVYLEGVSGVTIGEAGQVILVNCSDIQVRNLNLSSTTVGIELIQATGTEISGNHIANSYFGICEYACPNTVISENSIVGNTFGIYQYACSDSIVSGNNITDGYVGCYLLMSSDVVLYGNNIVNNSDAGYYQYRSSDNLISGNRISRNYIGLYAGRYEGDGNNIICGNAVMSNDYGIYCHHYMGDGNNIKAAYGNNITNNNFGIFFLESDSRASANNKFYHNNIVDNANQVFVPAGHQNVWDNGYPCGGNYWSDYAGVDLFSGPYQNKTGSDGIGDTPYIIDGDNTDTYPLIEGPTYDPHNIAIIGVAAPKSVVGQGCIFQISVTIINYDINAVNLSVRAYANTTIIDTKETILEGGNPIELAFSWNTTGFPKGRYTTKVYAEPVPAEIDTADNNSMESWVIVAMIGDLTGSDGSPDGKCNMRDVGLVARKFGKSYPDPEYDANCDITGPVNGLPDGIVNMRDVGTVARRFGETDP